MQLVQIRIDSVQVMLRAEPNRHGVMMITMRTRFDSGIAMRSALLGVLMLPLISLQMETSCGPLFRVPRSDYSPRPLIVRDVLLFPQLMGRLYFRPPCGNSDSQECPYAQPAIARTETALVALQSQLQLQAVDLPDVEFSGRDFSRMRYLFAGPTDCEGCGKEPPKVRPSDWNFANLSGTNLRGATLNGVSLRHARLDNTTLAHASLNDADLSWADLRDADLAASSLKQVDFSHADLSGTTLKDADLAGARLYGADLRAALGLTNAQLAACLGDQTTLLPPSVTRPAPWSTP